MSPFALGGAAPEGWGPIVSALRDHVEHFSRLDAVLEEVRAASGTATAHLFLADPAGRLLLERSVLGDAGSTVSAPDGAAGPAPVTVGSTLPDEGVPLELPLAPQLREDVVHVAAGPFHVVTFAASGARTGAVLVGPLSAAHLGRGARRRVEALALPLEAVALASRREQELRARLSAVEARDRAGRELASQAEQPARYVELLLQLSLRATGADGGFVAMASEGGDLRIRAREGFGTELDELDLSPETGVFDWSPAADGGALIVADLEAILRLEVRSIVAVPLLAGEEPLGIFAVIERTGGRRADARALDVLSTFARQIELMLDNERVYRQFSQAYLASLRGLAAALDERRPDTRGHHRAVEALARRIGRRMNLSASELDALATAAAIHDVGLAGVAGSEQAFELDQEHPTIGAGMVQHLPVDPLIAETIACHHEWIDGWGFPRGIGGEEIPMTGRILAAAEFVVEMGTETATREAWDAGRLGEELVTRRKTQFDPAVVDATTAVIAAGTAEQRTKET